LLSQSAFSLKLQQCALLVSVSVQELTQSIATEQPQVYIRNVTSKVCTDLLWTIKS
jgi:hypothetical protein